MFRIPQSITGNGTFKANIALQATHLLKEEKRASPLALIEKPQMHHQQSNGLPRTANPINSSNNSEFIKHCKTLKEEKKEFCSWEENDKTNNPIKRIYKKIGDYPENVTHAKNDKLMTKNVTIKKWAGPTPMVAAASMRTMISVGGPSAALLAASEAQKQQQDTKVIYIRAGTAAYESSGRCLVPSAKGFWSIRGFIVNTCKTLVFGEDETKNEGAPVQISTKILQSPDRALHSTPVLAGFLLVGIMDDLYERAGFPEKTNLEESFLHRQNTVPYIRNIEKTSGKSLMVNGDEGLAFTKPPANVSNGSIAISELPPISERFPDSGQILPDFTEKLKSILEDNGGEFRQGSSVSEIYIDNAAKVVAIQVIDPTGTTEIVPCDALYLSLGANCGVTIEENNPTIATKAFHWLEDAIGTIAIPKTIPAAGVSMNVIIKTHADEDESPRAINHTFISTIGSYTEGRDKYMAIRAVGGANVGSSGVPANFPLYLLNHLQKIYGEGNVHISNAKACARPLSMHGGSRLTAFAQNGIFTTGGATLGLTSSGADAQLAQKYFDAPETLSPMLMKSNVALRRLNVPPS